MKAAPEAGHVFQLMRRAAREDAGTRGGAGRNGAKSIREVHAFLAMRSKAGVFTAAQPLAAACS